MTIAPSIPGPTTPAWVNFGRYLRDPLGMMEGLRRDYGPVAYVPFPGQHGFFFVSDPVLVRRVLVDDAAMFTKGRALRAAKRLLGDGLLTSEGADHLLALRSEDGSRLLSDEEIRDEAITLMLAGHETTAQALTWTWYLLGRSDRAWDRLSAELLTVLGGRSPQLADYSDLTYTQAVFRESMRLYPPVWALARIASVPYMLGDHPVPADGTIVMSQWVMQRRPEHFAEPRRFRPERWLEDDPPAPGTYFPFAAGPRMCIGERFAMLEGTMILATLAQRWQVLTPAAEPVADARFTLRPRGGMRAVTVCAPTRVFAGMR